MPLYVVAIDRPVAQRYVTEYLGVSTAWRPDVREWWWVSPGDAADRPGYDDYTRFSDPADAAAWALRLHALMDDSEVEKRYGYRPYVREIS